MFLYVAILSWLIPFTQWSKPIITNILFIVMMLCRHSTCCALKSFKFIIQTASPFGRQQTSLEIRLVVPIPNERPNNIVIFFIYFFFCFTRLKFKLILTTIETCNDGNFTRLFIHLMYISLNLTILLVYAAIYRFNKIIFLPADN